MTEAEWLAATDPQPMLDFLMGKASSRKLICFFLAFCPDYTSSTTDRLDEALRPPWLDVHGPDDYTLPSQTRCLAWAKLLTHRNYPADHRTRPRAVAAPLLRDIFGNPFRQVTLNPAWLTSTVLALATGIYEEKAFDRMPILADALQDAGCDSEEILQHCRQPGEHVRGCWVVDLLGKEKVSGPYCNLIILCYSVYPWEEHCGPLRAAMFITF
jgi:hypothetical protein